LHHGATNQSASRWIPKPLRISEKFEGIAQDLDNKKVVLNRVVTFPAAGNYSVVADASGSKEVLPSASAQFTIPPS